MGTNCVTPQETLSLKIYRREVTPRNFVGGYQYFVSIFRDDSEERGSMFPRNVYINLQYNRNFGQCFRGQPFHNQTFAIFQASDTGTQQPFVLPALLTLSVLREIEIERRKWGGVLRKFPDNVRSSFW
jgi:hypothetical protein